MSMPPSGGYGGGGSPTTPWSGPFGRGPDSDSYTRPGQFPESNTYPQPGRRYSPGPAGPGPRLNGVPYSSSPYVGRLDPNQPAPPPPRR
jgi:hypothetical protein